MLKIWICIYGRQKLITLNTDYRSALVEFNKYLKGFTCGTIRLETTAYHMDYLKVDSSLYRLAVKFNDIKMLRCGQYTDVNKLLCERLW